MADIFQQNFDLICIWNFETIGSTGTGMDLTPVRTNGGQYGATNLCVSKGQFRSQLRMLRVPFKLQHLLQVIDIHPVWSDKSAQIPFA
jgi:hypothetical protein